MKHLFALFALMSITIFGFSQSPNEWVVDTEFGYSESYDWTGYQLEMTSDDANLIMINDGHIVKFDTAGTELANINISQMGGSTGTLQYLRSQDYIEQMEVFSEMGTDFIALYDSMYVYRVNVTTMNATPATLMAGGMVGDDYYEIDQLVHKQDDNFYVSFKVTDTVTMNESMEVWEVYLASGGLGFVSATPIYTNTSYDKIIGTPYDNGFMVIGDDKTVIQKMDALGAGDATFVTNINNSIDVLNISGFNWEKAAAWSGGHVFAAFTVLGNVHVVDATGTLVSGYNYPVHIQGLPATMKDLDVYNDAVMYTFDIAAPEYVVNAPFGIAVMQTDGCAWQFFASSDSNACIFNGSGTAGAGFNTMANPSNAEFDADGRVYVVGGSLTDWDETTVENCMRLEAFEEGQTATFGCTDPEACDYDAAASFNTGCDYSCFQITCYTEVDFDLLQVRVNWAGSPVAVDSYNIYRESATAGVYDFVANVPNTDRTYLDPSVDETSQAFVYVVVGVQGGIQVPAALDNVNPQGTVIAQGGQNTAGDFFLYWNNPVGQTPTEYRIYEVEYPTLTLLTTVSGNTNTYVVGAGPYATEYLIQYDVPVCELLMGDTSGGTAANSNSMFPTFGCTYSTATNYDASANYDDGSCTFSGISGCTDPLACNYNALAGTDNGSCEFTSCAGCTDPTACNYDCTKTDDDGSCEFVTCAGCTDDDACNYDPAATFDDGSCDLVTCAGCTVPVACNYDAAATIDDGSCEYTSCEGCTDSYACNYDPAATIFDGSCEYLTCAGCMEPSATNYDPAATIPNNTCLFGFGCTDPTACNYDACVDTDDGSCEFTSCLLGCTYPEAINYDPSAGLDNGLCSFSLISPDGCTYEGASNYDPAATVDDGSCVGFQSDCPADIDGDGLVNTNDLLSVLAGFGTVTDCAGAGMAPPADLLPTLEDIITKTNIFSEINMQALSTGGEVQLTRMIDYTIINVSGQVVSSRHSDKIDTRGLAAGVYLIATDSEVRKFVIVR